MSKYDSEKVVKDIRRNPRRKYSAEEKIRIVLDGLRGEDSIAELCRREGINQNVYYRWSKEFLEAGKQRLADDTKRDATVTEVIASSLMRTICSRCRCSNTRSSTPFFDQRFIRV